MLTCIINQVNKQFVRIITYFHNCQNVHVFSLLVGLDSIDKHQLNVRNFL